MAEKNKKGKVRIHDQSVNSYGIVILTAGIDLARYKANPVLIYNHNYEKVIGRLEDLEVIDNEIWGTPVFNSKNEFAAEKEQEFNDDFLKGFSIGIDEPYEFANGLNMGLGDVLVITKCQLFETTLCTIPSNKNAVKGLELSAENITALKLSLSNQTTYEMKDRAKLIAKLKLSADATDEQILEAIDKQAEAVNTANKKAEDAEKKAEDAEKKAEDAEKKATDTAATAQTEKINLMVEGAVKAGKITEDAKASYINLAKADFNSAKDVLDKMKPAVKPLQLTKPGTGTGTPVAGREEWTYDDWASKDSNGLKLMKQNDTDKFNELLEAKKAASKNR